MQVHHRIVDLMAGISKASTLLTQPVWKREFLGRQARHGDGRPGLGPDRLHQTTNAQNADYPFHIVGQDV